MDLKTRLASLLNSGELTLTSTHSRLSFPIIERMYKKMCIKLPFLDIQVVDGAIINGHHRYLAALLADYELGRCKGIRTAAKHDFDWKVVTLEDHDWNDPQVVNSFHIMDAEYLGISLEELLKRIE